MDSVQRTESISAREIEKWSVRPWGERTAKEKSPREEKEAALRAFKQRPINRMNSI